MAESKKTTIVEEIEVSGRELVDRVRELIKDSNASRITIRSQKGEELMTLPVSFGVVAGGIIAITAPILAAVGALAAVVTRVKLEVTREVEEAGDEETKAVEAELVTQTAAPAPAAHPATPQEEAEKPAQDAV